MIIKQIAPKQKEDIWNMRYSTLNKYLNGRLIVRTNDCVHLIETKKISYIQASGNYSIINIIDEQSVLSSKTLRLFEEKLVNKGFLRVHNGYLVNMDFVSRIIKNGMWKLQLKDGTKIPISRSYKEMLFNMLL